MPSVNGVVAAMDADIRNKTNQINAMLLRAWRERWSDAQWGINIKTILPPPVSGDTYNLAEQILQQALVGIDANKVLITYLRHSLGIRQISYTAIMQAIPKFPIFDRPYCLLAMFELLNFLCDGVCCRMPAEEEALPGSMLALVQWLLQGVTTVLDANDDKYSAQYQQILGVARDMMDKCANNHYIVANWHIATREDPERYKKIQKRYGEFKKLVATKKCTMLQSQMDLLPVVKSDGSILKHGKPSPRTDDVESITLCLQPYIVSNVLLHPNYSTKNYVAHLQMVQRLKNYPLARVYSELIRAAMITLHNVTVENDVQRESMWYAFAFIKVPHILKQLHVASGAEAAANAPYSGDMVQAIESIVDDPMFDLLDTTCATNTIEYLLKELVKHSLITGEHEQKFIGRRDPMLTQLMQIDLNHQPPATLKQLKKAEQLLGGILKALDNEYNKMQEPLLEMLGELLSGENFELILSVATVEGKLKTFVSRLIRWNENSRQASSDNTKPVSIRHALFDVTFLMLTFIVQTYGSDDVLDTNGTTFFERLVRDQMLEKGKHKPPMSMVQQCEQSKVDEFLSSMSANDALAASATPPPDALASAKGTTLKWHDICKTMPAIMYQLLVAWENHTITAADVKAHLDNIRKRLYSYSVCAASWLCAYMQSVGADEVAKPQSMLQQLVTPVAIAADDKRYNHKEAIAAFTAQLVHRIQSDAEQNQKVRSTTMNIVSSQPLEEQFYDVWRTISTRGWLSVKGAQVLNNLLESCGPYWLVSKMVNEVLLCKFIKDLNKKMDIVFAIMHLNIEQCTITLLNSLLPMILLNKTQKFDLIEPQLSILARLCVFCIVSALEMKASKSKRTLNGGNEASDVDARPNKVRKLADGTFEESVTRASLATSHDDSQSAAAPKMREPLKQCIEELFQTLYQLTLSTELTPKVIFVHQFLVLLHRCGGHRIRPILPLIPANLMQHLFKIMSVDEFSYDFILKMHDLNKETGRRNALADLSMFHTLKMKYPKGIQY